MTILQTKMILKTKMKKMKKMNWSAEKPAFDFINCLYNLSLTFVNFIVTSATHCLVFSFFYLLAVFFSGAKEPYRKVAKKTKFKSVSIFSVARDLSIALMYLSKASILKLLKSLNSNWLPFSVMLFSLKFSEIMNCGWNLLWHICNSQWFMIILSINVPDLWMTLEGRLFAAWNYWIKQFLRIDLLPLSVHI